MNREIHTNQVGYKASSRVAVAPPPPGTPSANFGGGRGSAPRTQAQREDRGQFLPLVPGQVGDHHPSSGGDLHGSQSLKKDLSHAGLLESSGGGSTTTRAMRRQLSERGAGAAVPVNSVAASVVSSNRGSIARPQGGPGAAARGGPAAAATSTTTQQHVAPPGTTQPSQQHPPGAPGAADNTAVISCSASVCAPTLLQTEAEQEITAVFNINIIGAASDESSGFQDDTDEESFGQEVGDTDSLSESTQNFRRSFSLSVGM